MVFLTCFNILAVTLPDGVTAGQTIHVQAPDGRLNAIVVPAGMGAGSTFTVEFAPPEAANGVSPTAVAPSSQTPSWQSVPPSTQGHAPVSPSPPAGGDDGFVSGFGNSSYQPPTASAVPANRLHGNLPTAPATLY